MTTLIRRLVSALPRGRQKAAHALVWRSRIFEMVGPLHGLRMHLEGKDPFQAEMACGVYQSDLMDSLASLVRPGDVVLTAGAHLGYVMLALANMGSTVIGCECDPNLVDKCQANLDLNTVDARLINVGLGSKEAQLELNVSSTPGQSSFSIAHHATQKHFAKVRRGDDVLQELGVTHLDGLFLDVEGWESHVLEGLELTMRNPPRWAIVECFDVALEKAGSSAIELKSKLLSYGYQITAQGGDLICTLTK